MIEPLIKTFDVSRLGTYLDCRRHYKFRYLDHWASRTARNVSAEYGTATHAFMEVWHGVREWEPAWQAFEASWAEAGGDDAGDATRTAVHAKWFLKRYVEKYPVERFRVQHTEQPFEVAIGPYLFVGRLDKIVRFPDGMMQVMDHKTTSQLGYTSMLRYRPNLQTLGYVWAARELVSPNLYTIVYDIISTAKNATKPIDECFARKVESFTDDELDEFPGLFTALANEINANKSRDSWLPNFSQCTSYGECPFRKVCTQPKQMWESVLGAHFERNEWNPARAGETILRKETHA